jgi:hypothetical protein
LYPLFQAQWDRCDQQNHRTYLVKGHHLYQFSGDDDIMILEDKVKTGVIESDIELSADDDEVGILIIKEKNKMRFPQFFLHEKICLNMTSHF